MALDTDNSSQLTTEQVRRILVEPLLGQAQVLAAGPRVFDSNGSPVRVPTLKTYNLAETGTGASASYWVGENSQITGADADFDEVTLLPSGLKSIKTLHRFSNELARSAVVDVASALQGAVVRRVALALDEAFLTGTGDNDTVEGITHWDNVQEITGVGASVTFDTLLEAEEKALTANASPSCWFMSSRDFARFRKAKDLQDHYLLTDDVTSPGTYRLVGYPVKITNALLAQDGSSSIVLADMSQVAVGRDLAPSVRILDQTFGDYDQLALRVVTRYDIKPLNAEGVVVLRGITA